MSSTQVDAETRPAGAVATTESLLAGGAAIATRRRRQVGRVLSANRIMLGLSLGFVGLIVLASAFPGILSPGDPLALHSERVLEGPGETLLGTDQYGRSVFGLIVHGSRVSAMVGLAAVALACVTGSLIGLVAGFFGGRIDGLLGRVVDVLMCFPGILLALIVAAALGPSTRNLILSVALATMPIFARVSRGQVISMRGRLFVTAARAAGVPTRRLLVRHIVPNSLTPIVVLATVSVGTSIVIAASLSYLGVGPQNELPDWGQLLSSGQPYLSGAWWISTFPGLVITLTVIAVSILGDWLRDRLEQG